jgi:hypothetical protein
MAKQNYYLSDMNYKDKIENFTLKIFVYYFYLWKKKNFLKKKLFKIFIFSK